MLFNSLEFAVFLPIVFTIYWLLNQHLRWQNLFLLLASYYFYACWDARFLGLLILSSLVDYTVGIQLDKHHSISKRKRWLMVSIIVNLGVLSAFKYYNFFIQNFEDFLSFFGKHPNVHAAKIILPVGISFYTFQTMSYSIDVYKKRIKPTDNIVDFFAFVSYFPQLVAGPIERASQLIPQIKNRKTFDYNTSVYGLRQMLWGFFKKLVIADGCAEHVSYIFDNAAHLNSFTLLAGIFLFALQIYGDFSGYSDIAIGTSKLFGIRLNPNFRYPYFSQNLIEFWRRWHISLSSWFRDYVYIPLGGNHVSHVIFIRNIMIVFVLSGLWHGAAWTFVLWGAYHGVLLILTKFSSNINLLKRNYSITNIPKILLTFILVCIGWVFFRAANISDSFIYLARIFTTKFQFQLDFPWFQTYLKVIITIFIVWEWLFRNREHGLYFNGLKMNRVCRWLIYMIFCYMIFRYGVFNSHEFIYFAF